MVRVHSRRNNEWTCIYASGFGKQWKLLVATAEGNDWGWTSYPTVILLIVSVLAVPLISVPPFTVPPSSCNRNEKLA